MCRCRGPTTCRQVQSREGDNDIWSSLRCSEAFLQAEDQGVSCGPGAVPRNRRTHLASRPLPKDLAHVEKETATLRAQLKAAAERAEREEAQVTLLRTIARAPSIQHFRDAILNGKFDSESDQKYMPEIATTVLLSPPLPETS